MEGLNLTQNKANECYACKLVTVACMDFWIECPFLVWHICPFFDDAEGKLTINRK